MTNHINLQDYIPLSWKYYIDDDLINQINNKLSTKECIKPSIDNIFNCFKYFDLIETKVVMMGYRPFQYVQDGLAFSCPDTEHKKPIENKIIINEIFSNYNRLDMINKNKKSDLSYLAEQGVLLMNSILTTGKNKDDHKDVGWQYLTNNIIKKISINNDNVVFLLFGNEMHDKCEIINNIDRHKIIKTSYPINQTLKNENYRKDIKPFLNSKCFLEANEYLLKHKNIEIDWISKLL